MLCSFPVSLEETTKTFFIENPHQNERISKNCLQGLLKILRMKCGGNSDFQMEMMGHVGYIFYKFKRAECNGKCSNS